MFGGELLNPLHKFITLLPTCNSLKCVNRLVFMSNQFSPSISVVPMLVISVKLLYLHGFSKLGRKIKRFSTRIRMVTEIENIFHWELIMKQYFQQNILENIELQLICMKRLCFNLTRLFHPTCRWESLIG